MSPIDDDLDHEAADPSEPARPLTLPELAETAPLDGEED